MEEKGIYSIEKFLMARRLMYWQAYLHKTSLVAELILTKILKRAKELSLKGISLKASDALSFFMSHKIELAHFDTKVLQQFAELDDFDIVSALKAWQYHDDFILSQLSRMIIHRDLLKIRLSSDKFELSFIQDLTHKCMSEYKLSAQDAQYFIFKGKIKNQAYNKSAEPIRILKKDKSIEDVVEASDQLNLKALSKPVTKYYVCYPKQLIEN